MSLFLLPLPSGYIENSSHIVLHRTTDIWIRFFRVLKKLTKPRSSTQIKHQRFRNSQPKVKLVKSSLHVTTPQLSHVPRKYPYSTRRPRSSKNARRTWRSVIAPRCKYTSCFIACLLHEWRGDDFSRRLSRCVYGSREFSRGGKNRGVSWLTDLKREREGNYRVYR